VYHAKWNKSDRERQIAYNFICECNQKKKKQSKQMKQTHRYREQTGGHQREGK